MTRPRCQECEAAGVQYRAQEHGGMSTLMAVGVFWDEVGQRHVHDQNIHTTLYHCSTGHGWSESERYGCGVVGCDFNAESA